jgi:tetratricopeptide (TPR) repeat protein
LLAAPFTCFSYERTVKLQQGETVSEIGKKNEFYGTWNEEIKQELIKANSGIDIDKTKAGVTIIFPYLPKFESINVDSIKNDIRIKRDEISNFVDNTFKIFTYGIALIALVLAISGVIGFYSIKNLTKLEKELRERFPSLFEAQTQLEYVTKELIGKYGKIDLQEKVDISEAERIRIIDIAHQISSLSIFSSGKKFMQDLSRGFVILGTFYYRINDAKERKDANERNIESGIYFYKKAIKYDKKNSKAYFFLAWMLNRRAQMLLKKRENDAAKNTYEQVLENVDLGLMYDKYNAKQLYNKGWYLDEMGRYKDAIKAYLSAEKINAIDPDIPYNIACAYAKLGNCKKAVFYLQKSIDLDPGLKAVAAGDEDFTQCRSVDGFRELILFS